MSDETVAAIGAATLHDLLHYLVDQAVHASEEVAKAWHERIDAQFIPPTPPPGP